MKMKKLAVKFLAVAALFVSTTGVCFAYDSYRPYHYDHATVGQKFNRFEMVTEYVGGHYLRDEQANVYSFRYADGTMCHVVAGRDGIVKRIYVTTP